MGRLVIAATTIAVVPKRLCSNSKVSVCLACEEAEIDEQWSFVSKKSNQRWLWYAIDHATNTVLAYVFGRRKDEVFKKLKIPWILRTGRLTMTNKTQLPSKCCPVCHRPFSWRKKWSTCWDSVKYCSERCRRQRNNQPVKKVDASCRSP